MLSFVLMGEAEHDEAAVRLEPFLLGGAAPPDVAVLEKYRLAAYAYTRFSNGSPHRLALRESFLAATARHFMVKAVLLPLVRVWRRAGIDIFIFKRFFLSEFVYPEPAQRFYNDVDLLIRPEHAAEACRLARELGWTELWNRQDSLYTANHEESVLSRAGVVVEIHRYIIDSNSPNDRLQKRYTRAARDGSFGR